MQEEVNEKTISLCIKGGKITAQILKAALIKLLAEMDKKKQQAKGEKSQCKKTGRQSIKSLQKSGAQITNIVTLSDERIEKAITQNGARLIILDPIQAYMGDKADMNKANEVRPIFRRLAEVAERTGCAVILIGHLNKAAGGQSAYRGLGSIDFRAAARSVLLIGRVKREPNVRVIVHDKSSLVPEGKPVAFCLDPETGFSWIGEYDITADELLSGAGGNTATKTEQAERLILDLLADGKELASEDIVKAAAEAGISERTVQNAKRNMGGILGARRVGGQWYNFIKKKQPPEPAS